MDIMKATLEEVTALLLAELNRDTSGLITRNAQILINITEQKLRERISDAKPRQT